MNAQFDPVLEFGPQDGTRLDGRRRGRKRRMPYALTAIERRILEVVCAAVSSSGRPPSITELTEAAQLRSVASLHWYLDRLQEKGLIRPHPTRTRAIEVDCQSLELATASQAAASEPAATVHRDESRAASTAPTTSEPATVSGTPTDKSGGHVNDVPGQKAKEEGTVPPILPESADVEVRLFGEVAAGSPIEVDDEPLAVYRLPSDLVGYGDMLLMVRIHGQSMHDAGIFDGDFVVIRRQDVIDDGEIVAVHVEDEGTTVKRVSRRGGRVRLLADNPAYEPIEPEEAQVLGKVVTVIRRVR